MTLSSLTFNRWVHHHEEDTDEVAVYRPEDYPFQPSRGREGFEIYEDGRFVELVIAATDDIIEQPAHWSELDDGQLKIHREDAMPYTIDIMETKEDVLKVRKEQ